MPLSTYDITVPVFLRALANLSAQLEKGRAHAEAEGTDPADLLAARLAPDMFTLTQQVQRASDTAKLSAVRLGGIENLPFEDNETSFEELQDRIARTRAFLAAAPRAAFEANAGGTVTLTQRSGSYSFGAAEYATQFALPNFFFHAVTAFGILRHKGVPIGKTDFLGPFTPD